MKVNIFVISFFQLLFVDKNTNKIYLTSDEGKTYTGVMGCPGSTDKLVFHPTNETMILCYSELERKVCTHPC